jgi:hypothetical protein
MTSGGYLSRYSQAAAVGFVLMAFLFLSALREAAERGDRKEGERLLRNVAIGFGTILFAPAIIWILNNGSIYAASGFKGSVVDPSLQTAVSRLGSIGAVTAALPGGAFVGFILFGLMMIGALGMFVGNVVNRYGLEMASVAIAILAGTRVHPRWEARGQRAALTILGLLLARPLLMLVLGWTAGIISDNLDPTTLSAGGMQTLTALGVATVAIVSLGLAPFALLKWLPISPTRPQSHDHSGGSGGIAGPMLAAMAGSALGGRRASAGVDGAPGRVAPSPSASGAGTGTAQTPSRGAQSDPPTADRPTRSVLADGMKTSEKGGASHAATGSKSVGATAVKSAAGVGSAGGMFAAEALRQLAQSGVQKARHVAQNQGTDVDHELARDRL